MEKHFIDIPVYRISLEKYQQDRDKYIEEQMYGKPPDIDYEMKEFHKRNPEMKKQFEQHLWQRYGGSWHFNEIIGWIQLYFLGSQIRGVYSSVTAKKIMRTRKKIYEFKTDKIVSEMDIPPSASNPEIFKIVQSYLAECRKVLRRRHLDTSRLEIIGPYLDWRGLINDN